jgi:hypothetical protein
MHAWRDRESNPGHDDFQSSAPGPENAPICRRSARGGAPDLPLVSWGFLGVWAGGGPPRPKPRPARSADGERRTRTADTAIFSRVLYQLSYLAATLDPTGSRVRGGDLALNCGVGLRGQRGSNPVLTPHIEWRL